LIDKSVHGIRSITPEGGRFYQGLHNGVRDKGKVIPRSVRGAIAFSQVSPVCMHCQDAIALLRMDDLFIDTFEIKDGMSLAD